MKKYFSPSATVMLVAKTADIITMSYDSYSFDKDNAKLGGIGSGDDITAYKG